MEPLAALIVLAALLAVVVTAGVLVRLTSRRPRRIDPAERVDPRRLGADGLGEQATLLQFSTDFCARCPGTHRMLADVATDRTGVRHLDVDLTERPDIARHFRVLQTPTTLILDRHGVVRTRFGGTPGRNVIELELARIVEESSRV